MATEKEKDATIEGTVTEALPDAMFRIETDDGQKIIAYLAGKMRLHRIKVLVGDRVLVLQSPYGGKGRGVRKI